MNNNKEHYSLEVQEKNYHWNKAYYEANREKIREYYRKYYQAHKEEIQKKRQQRMIDSRAGAKRYRDMSLCIEAGKRVVNLREKYGDSTFFLSRETGITFTSLRKLENGETENCMALLPYILKYYGITFEQFWSGE